MVHLTKVETILPIYLESFSAGTLTFLVSHARNAPNINNRPSTPNKAPYQYV